MMGTWGVMVGPDAATESDHSILRIGKDAYVWGLD
jgi:hypothetical protein